MLDRVGVEEKSFDKLSRRRLVSKSLKCCQRNLTFGLTQKRDRLSKPRAGEAGADEVVACEAIAGETGAVRPEMAMHSVGT